MYQLKCKPPSETPGQAWLPQARCSYNEDNGLSYICQMCVQSKGQSFRLHYVTCEVLMARMNALKTKKSSRISPLLQDLKCRENHPKTDTKNNDGNNQLVSTTRSSLHTTSPLPICIRRRTDENITICINFLSRCDFSLGGLPAYWRRQRCLLRLACEFFVWPFSEK